MRTTSVLFLLFSATLARADSTILDPFHQSQSNCSYSMSSPYSSCDVIGDESMYDIQSVSATFSGNTAQIQILLNYGNSGVNYAGGSLAQFTDYTLTLGVGDLLLFNPTNWNGSSQNQPTYQYGVPLTTRGSFVAGDVYHVGNGISTETADDVIHNTGYYYRRNQMVWLTDTTGIPLPATSGGTVVVKDHGNGTSAAKYEVDISFTDPSGFLSTLRSPTGQIGISFASADCGNDIIMGTVTAVPEPGSTVLFGVMSLLSVLALRKLVTRGF